MSNYPGIDYSMGKSNVNHRTGIHYGIIPMNSIGQMWFDSSEPYYGDPICPNCSYEFRRAKNPVKCPACKFRPDDDSQFHREEPLSFDYNRGGYQLFQSHDDSDIFVIKSPFFTYSQFCSPCAPGAGYTLNPIAPEDGGVKTYCLGHDWFEAKETGKWIDCKFCQGTGHRWVKSIPNFNKERFIANGGVMHGDSAVECWVCYSNRQFGQIGMVKEMIHKAPYPVYSVKTGKPVNPNAEE